MKVVDAPRWREQQAELSVDENGKIFLEFLQDWVDLTERGLRTGTHLEKPLSPLEILRFNFETTEEKFGQIPGVWLGQMLLVIVGNWVHGGKDLVDAMTCFERRIVEEAKARQIYELQEAAAQAGGSLPDYLQMVPTE